MHIDDFKKQDRGPRLYDHWLHPDPIPTPLGPFFVELMPDGGEPDIRMVEEAVSLVEFLRSNAQAIVNHVHEHYRHHIEHHEWMEECGVPLDLETSDLVPFLRVRSIVVERDGGPPPTYEAWFYVSPQWDVEHAIYLSLTNGTLSFRDDC